jgi:hypothetical protein
MAMNVEGYRQKAALKRKHGNVGCAVKPLNPDQEAADAGADYYP